MNMAINLSAGREAVGSAQCWASEMHKCLVSVYTWKGFFSVSRFRSVNTLSFHQKEQITVFCFILEFIRL